MLYAVPCKFSAAVLVTFCVNLQASHFATDHGQPSVKGCTWLSFMLQQYYLVDWSAQWCMCVFQIN